MWRFTWICPRLATQYAVLIIVCFYIAAGNGGPVRVAIHIIRVFLGHAVHIGCLNQSPVIIVLINCGMVFAVWSIFHMAYIYGTDFLIYIIVVEGCTSSNNIFFRTVFCQGICHTLHYIRSIVICYFSDSVYTAVDTPWRV